MFGDLKFGRGRLSALLMSATALTPLAGKSAFAQATAPVIVTPPTGATRTRIGGISDDGSIVVGAA